MGVDVDPQNEKSRGKVSLGPHGNTHTPDGRSC